MAISNLLTDKLIKSSGLLFMAVALASVFNYAFQIAMGRMLLPKEYGMMNALLSIFMIVIIPLTPLFTVITRKMAEYKALNDLSHIHYLYRRMSKMIIAGGLCIMFVFITLSPVLRDYFRIPSLVAIGITALSFVPTLSYNLNLAVLQGVQDYKWLGINQVVSGPARFIIAMLFVWFGFGLNGAMAGIFVAGFLCSGISYVSASRYVKDIHEESGSPQAMSMADVAPVFLATFAFTILSQADIVLVKHYFSAYEAGVYSSAGVLGKTFMYIPGAIVLAMFPMVTEQYALNQSSRLLLFKSLLITVIISGSGALFFYIFPDTVINVIYGHQYASAAPILKYYGLAMLPLSLLMVLMNYLIAREKNVFSYLLAAGAFLEILGVFMFHDLLIQIVIIMLSINIFLLIMGIMIQYFPKVQLNVSKNHNY